MRFDRGAMPFCRETALHGPPGGSCRTPRRWRWRHGRLHRTLEPAQHDRSVVLTQSFCAGPQAQGPVGQMEPICQACCEPRGQSDQGIGRNHQPRFGFGVVASLTTGAAGARIGPLAAFGKVVGDLGRGHGRAG